MFWKSRLQPAMFDPGKSEGIWMKYLTPAQTNKPRADLQLFIG